MRIEALAEETPKKAGETEIADTPNPIQVVVKRKANNQLERDSRAALTVELAKWDFVQQAKQRDDRERDEDFGNRYGVSRNALTDLRKTDNYIRAVREHAGDALIPHAAQVYAQLVKRATLGDPTMTKLYLQQAKLLEAERSESRNLHLHVEAGHIPRPTIDKASE